MSSSLQQGRELLAGVAEVASLESRLAALSLAQMLSLAVATALLACSAWGLALAALAFALAGAGIPWLWLLPSMAIANGLLAWWIWHRLSALSDDLGFQATRKLLRTLPATLSTSEQSHEKPPATAP